jgi:hypothetical protein
MSYCGIFICALDGAADPPQRFPPRHYYFLTIHVVEAKWIQVIRYTWTGIGLNTSQQGQASLDIVGTPP